MIMKKTIEQYVDELINNIKEEENPIKLMLKKETEDVSCNFIARTTGVVSGVRVAQYIFKRSSNKIGFKIIKDDASYVNRGDVICSIAAIKPLTEFNFIAFSRSGKRHTT